MPDSKELPIQCELFPGETRREQQDAMAFPFASFSPSTDRLQYTHSSQGSTTEVVVESGPRGMATIHDFDLLIYCASVIRKAMNEDKEAPRTVTFVPRQFLKWAGRGVNGRSYERLHKALRRLASTYVETTIRGEDAGKNMRGFTWIDWEIVGEDTQDELKRDNRITISISQWLWEGIVNYDLILSIDEAYFGLRSGYERFLYRLFRKSVGRGNFWSWRMTTLRKKAGTNLSLSKFAYKIRDYVERSSIPRFELSRYRRKENDPKTEWVRAFDEDFYEACLQGRADLPSTPWKERGG